MSSRFVRIDGVDGFFQEMNNKLEEFPELIIDNLQYIGEAAVSYARNSHELDWIDRSGNLRSSIGYKVLRDGKPVREYTPRQVKEGSEGIVNAQKLLEELAQKYPKGCVLIICAGMNYASYVENIHGKDVLTGAKALVKELIQTLLK